MAEAEMTYSAEHIQRLLQCSVCLDRFKQPKLLPCQHTFCLRPCLEGLVDRLIRMVRCPECRADHIVPRGGPANFPNNLTIISFLELPALGGGNGERGNGGGVAVRDGQPSIDPLTGRPLLAAGQQSKSGGGARGMPSIGAERAGAVGGARDVAAAAAVGGGGGCAACRMEGRRGRCSHCDQLLCDACRRGHMEMVRTDVNRTVSQVRRSLPLITEQINQIGRRGAQLQNGCESLKAEVSETLDKHIRELRTRERLLHDDIDSFLVSELRGLRTHQENLEVELAGVASFCDSSESTLSRSRYLTDGDLMEMKRQCTEHLNLLHDYESGTLRPPVPRNIQLSAESQFLSTTISNFGDLIITSGSSAVLVSPEVPTQGLNTGATRRNVTQERRTMLQAPDTATDHALSVLSSRSSSLSPSVTRHNVTPSPSAETTQGLNFTDDDLYEDDEPPPARTQVRRRLRRQHHSDTRIAGLMGGGATDGAGSGGSGSDPSSSQQTRHNGLRRHRSLGCLPPADDTSDQTESSPERETQQRHSQFLHRTFGGFVEEDDSEPTGPVGIGMAPALTYPLTRRSQARAPVRFEVSVPEDTDSDEPRRNGSSVQAYRRADNSPSMYVTTPRNRYDQKGQAMIRFGSRGSGERQFTWPRGVAVSPLDDNIFVSDSSNHRVQVFDNIGVYLKSFGRYGQADGEFDCLAGITVNGLGQIIIADRYNHRIQIFDRNGSFHCTFGSEGVNDGQLNYPWGVACDKMGFIYVCDKENHRIQVFQSNGTFVRKFGRLGKAAGQFDNPHYVAVSCDNKVYVSDSSNHRIQVFSIYGDFLFSFGINGTLRGQMKFPRGIAIDNQGFIVVADSGNNRVQIFRADGRFFSMFGSWGSENGQFKGLEGVAILASGNVVVSDRENHRIQIF